MKVSTGSLAVAGFLLLALTGCAGAGPAPAPTSSSSASPSSTPTPTPTSGPSGPDEVEVTAAVVVMTATATSVFGTDGSTLATVTYEMDEATAVAQLAAALDAEPVVTPIPAIGDDDGPCPPATSYDFGGLELRWPGSLWSVGSYEVIVTGATTADGVAIETVAGQQIGATRAAFRAAIGDVMPISDEPSGAMMGYDIVNPESHEWDRIGALAIFADDSLAHLAAPVRVGFIGSCA